MIDTIVLVPCYKRFNIVKKIVANYAKSNLDILLFTQGYSTKQVCILKQIYPNANFVSYDRGMGIGYIRKSMFTYLFEVLSKNYKFVIMHDNDLVVQCKDIQTLTDRLQKDNRYNICSPDIYSICGDLHELVTDMHYNFVAIRYNKLQKIWHKLSMINNCEDVELNYLLGNTGYAINKKYFLTDFSLLFSETSTIPNWLDNQKKAIEFLKTKYGKKSISIFDRIKNRQKVVKFSKVNKPKLILFEGLDKTGKSSIIIDFCKVAKFAYSVVDRCFISDIVYDEYYDRNIVDSNGMHDFLLRNADDILIVYCITDKATLQKRYVDTNHEIPDIDRQRKLFDRQINRLSKTNNILVLDTSKSTIQTSVNRLIRYLNS